MDKTDLYQRWLNIDPSEHPICHYRLLGLAQFESDEVAIKNAISKRVAYVQDLSVGTQHLDESQSLLNEIAAASRCLTNPESKSLYDDQLRRDCATSQSMRPEGDELLGEDREGASSRRLVFIGSGVAILVVVLVSSILLFFLNRSHQASVEMIPAWHVKMTK